MSEGILAKNKINFYVFFWLFLIGSVLGFIVEGVWEIIKNGYWVNHSAAVWGPFCIIYGVGVVALYLSSYFLENKTLPTKFVLFSISGAVVEYFGSLFQEKFLGSVSWDYSSHPFNLGGRVSLRMALIWGILGIVFMYFIYPSINRLFLNINTKQMQIVTYIVAIFMAVNLAVTSLTVTRWEARLNNIPPNNKIESIIDNTYGNEKMKEIFSNMEFVE